MSSCKRFRYNGNSGLRVIYGSRVPEQRDPDGVRLHGRTQQNKRTAREKRTGAGGIGKAECGARVPEDQPLQAGTDSDHRTHGFMACAMVWNTPEFFCGRNLTLDGFGVFRMSFVRPDNARYHIQICQYCAFLRYVLTSQRTNLFSFLLAWGFSRELKWGFFSAV